MANPINQDLLRKLLEGKTSTEDTLTTQEEPLGSGVIPKPSSINFGPLLGSSGDLRFIGDVDDYSLNAQSAPATTPYRHRRLAQQKLLYGAKVLAEGTDGTLTNGSATFTSGLSDLSYLTGFGLANLRLVISNTSSIGSGDASVITTTFGIDAVAGANLTLDRAYSSAFTPLTSVYWQVILPQPVELLGWPGSNDAESLVYLCTKPGEWPIRNSAVTLDTSAATAQITAENRLEITAETSDPQVFQVGDWASVSGEPFYVQDVSYTPGTPNTEIITLTPFYGSEFPVDLLNLPSTVTKMYSVADLITDPYTKIDEFLGETVWEAEDGRVLEDLRVKNLVRPDQVPEKFRNSVHGVFLSPEDATAPQPGYGLALFPADGSGDPDLANPILDLENLTIDPSITEAQQVFVDYTEGLIRLSHPISLTGGDLNPNAYTDSRGRPKLFAAFVVHNGSALPQASQSLEDYAPGLASANSAQAKRGASQTRVRVDAEGLEISVSSEDDIYHEDDLSEREVIRSGTTDRGYGPLHEVQYRSPASRRLMRSEYRMGTLAVGDRRRQFIVRPVLVEEGSADGDTQYDWRLAEGQKQVDTTTDDLYAAITASTNIVSLIANGVPFTVTLTPGPAPTAAALAASISGAYTAAEAALGLPAQDFSADVVDSGGNDLVRITTSGDLYLRNGTAHAALGLATDSVVNPSNIYQQWGFDGDVERQEAYSTTTQDLEASYKDIRLYESDVYNSSLRGASQTADEVYPKFVISGGAPTSSGAATVDVASMVIKHPNYDAARGATITEVAGATFDFSAEADGTYFIYYDFTTQALAFIDRTTVGFDPLFDSAPNYGLPIAQLQVASSLVPINQIFDVRRFANRALESNFITVGSNGTFKTLRAACAYVANRNTGTGPTANVQQGAFTIRLLEDITLDGTQSDENVYIPSNTVLDLAGNTITCDSWTGGPGTGPFFLGNQIGDDEFVATNVVVRNGQITCSNFGSGATAPDLFISLPGAAGFSAFDVTFEDLRFDAGGPQEVNRFVDVEVASGFFETAVKIRRCVFEFNTVFVGTLVEYVGGVSGIVEVEDSVIYCGTSNGAKAAIDINAVGTSTRIINSTITLIDGGADQKLFSDIALGSPAASSLYIQNSTIQGADANIIESDSSVANPLRLEIVNSSVNFDNAFALVINPSGILDGAIIKVTDCEIIDNLDSAAGNPQISFGEDCEISFSGSRVSNFVMLGTANTNTSVVRVDSCRFLGGLTEEQDANGGSGGGTSCLISLTAGNLYMSNTRFQGRIDGLSGTTDGSLLFLSNSFISGSVGAGAFGRIVDLEGGFAKITNCTFTNATAGTSEILRIREAGTGVVAEPQVVLTGCRFAHTVNNAILIDGAMDAVNIMSSYFSGVGGGAAAIEVTDQGASNDVNLHVSGGQMEGYPNVATDSQAIIIGDNNQNAQFVALFVRTGAAGITDFDIGAGTGDIYTETTVRFIQS